MIKDNSMASTVSHTEDCLYGISEAVASFGSLAQKDALQLAFSALEKLYYLLREEE
jgi:hypothetical protein